MKGQEPVPDHSGIGVQLRRQGGEGQGPVVGYALIHPVVVVLMVLVVAVVVVAVVVVVVLALLLRGVNTIFLIEVTHLKKIGF